MAMQELFGNRIPPACRYCEQSLCHIPEDGMVLCEKKGIVPEEYHCRRYRYDPIKRPPKSKIPLRRFEEQEFSL